MEEKAKERIDKYFAKNFPELIGEYRLILKPTKIPNINEHEGVRSILSSIFIVFLSKENDSVTKLYILVRRFAKLVGDEIKVDKLYDVYMDPQKKLSVPMLELVLKKYLTNTNYKLQKEIANGKKSYTLVEVNEILQERKTQIFDIFGEIYDENDIRMPFGIPNFNGSETNEMLSDL